MDGMRMSKTLGLELLGAELRGALQLCRSMTLRKLQAEILEAEQLAHYEQALH